jgi:peptide/nickel transport system permease protein
MARFEEAGTRIGHSPVPTWGQRVRAQLAGAIHLLFGDLQTGLGSAIVMGFLALAVIGPLIAPFTANDQHSLPLTAPGGENLLGTDALGRDIFSRIILGTRSIFVTAGTGTLIAVLIGAALGLFIGFRGGWIDEVVSRVIDAFLALPALLVALVVLGVVRNLDAPPGSLQAALADSSVLLVIALVYVPIVARVVRSGTLDIKTRAFVQAAQIRGESSLYIIFREILPSVMPALVVEASLRFSYAIFLVASLGFLGAGARPPSPDWGLMVNENRRIYAVAPWAVSYPAAAIALLVVGVNLMSDGIKRLVQRGG